MLYSVSQDGLWITVVAPRSSVSQTKLVDHALSAEFVFPVLPKLFIKSNQGEEETTKINYLTFIGTPVQATNMNDFRRVRTVAYLRCPRLCETRRNCECVLFRLWERLERVTEQKEEKRRRLEMHSRTFCLPKLPQLTLGSKRIMCPWRVSLKAFVS